MDKQNKRAAAAAAAAVCVLLAGAFAPPHAAAWWCTAFSLTCTEAAQPQTGSAPEYRSLLLDWLGGR